MIVTRCLTRADLPKLYELYQLLGESLEEPELADDWMLCNSFARPEYKAFGFWRDDVLIGFLDVLISEPRVSVTVVNVFIRPPFRHRTGSLFRTALHWLSAHGYRRVNVAVAPGKEAIWVKHHFVPDTLFLTKEVT